MSLIQQRRLAAGMALLDEVMVAVVTGKLSPILTGIAYCQMIDLCQAVFDLRRARESTGRRSPVGVMPSPTWSLPRQLSDPSLRDLSVARQVWHDALDAAQRACDLLAGPTALGHVRGSAYYQLGEIRRLRGEFALAEAS